MKKKFFTLFLLIFLTFTFFNFKVYAKENIDENYIYEILKGEAYSYLNDEAKEFVINFYNETGEVLFTEKNKEPGSIYLNPDYVDYLGLSDEERSKYSIIPPVYKIADKKTPFDYNSSSSKNRFKSMVFSSVLTPSSFDLRNVDGNNYITPMKNQGGLGLCWAFATVENAETYLMYTKKEAYNKNTTETFSIRQMDYVTSSNGLIVSSYYGYKNNENAFRTLGSGGHFFGSSLAMMNGITLTDESVAPWNESLSYYSAEKILNFEQSKYEIDSTIMLPKLDYLTATDEEKQTMVNKIKDYIIKYGAPYVGTYSPQSRCGFQNEDGSYVLKVDECVDVSQAHAMQIIGWKDNYSYSYCDNGEYHYSSEDGSCSVGNYTTGRGAWIVRNSWGDDPDYKYIYLTYDSAEYDIGFITSLNSMEDREWDNNYHSMPLSSSGSYYLNSSDINYITTYTGKLEKLEKIKFLTENSGANYTIKIDPDGSGYTTTKTIIVNEPGVVSVDFSNDDILVKNNFKVYISGDSRYTIVDKSLSVFTSNIDEEPAVEYYLIGGSNYISESNPIMISDYSNTKWELDLIYFPKNFNMSTKPTYRLEKDGVVYDLFGSTNSYYQLDSSGQVNFINFTAVTYEGKNGNEFRMSDAYCKNYNLEVLYNGKVINRLPVKFACSDGTYKYEIILNSNNGNGYSVSRLYSSSTVVNLKNLFIDKSKMFNDGYYITGWNTKPDGTGTTYALDATITVTKDFKLYAVWSSEKLNTNVIYNSNCDNCTGTMENQKVSYGSNIDLKTNNYLNEGYKFLYWSLSGVQSSKLNYYYDFEDIPYESVIKNPIYNNEDLYLYAIWSNDYKKVSFDANGGEGSMNDIYVQTSVDSKNIRNTFTMTDHYFVEWNTKPDGTGQSFDDGEAINVSEDTILYAQWDVPKYSISIIGGSANVDVSPKNETITISADLSKENDRIFDKWIVKTDGVVLGSLTDPVTTFTMPEFNVEFEAKFKYYVDKPTVKKDVFEYNKNEQSLLLENFDSEKLNISNNVGTEINSYNAIISIKDKDNNIWRDKTYDDITIPWSIVKASVEKPTINEKEFTYNGKEQTLNINGFDSEIMNISGNKGTEVGKYTAVISLKDKEHYVWKDNSNTDISIEWNINKILVDKPSVDNTEFTYNGKELTLNINGFDSEIMNISSNKGTEVGKYTAVISLKDKEHYAWKDNSNTDISVEWNINKILVDKPSVDNTEFTYNGKEQTLNINGFDSEIMSITNNKAINAGKYTAVISLKDKEHYAWKDNTNTDISIEWNVNKILVDKPSVDNTEFTYNGEEQTLNINGFDSEIMSITNNKAINAGKYTAVISLKDKNNYVWEDNTNIDISILWNINKYVVLKPIAKKVSYEFNSKEQTLLLDNFDSDIMNIVNNTGVVVNEYTTVISLKDKNNYVWEDNTNDDISIIWNIVWPSSKIVLDTPILNSDVYYYDGNEIVIKTSEYNTELITLSGTTGTDIGEYKAVFSLKDKEHYSWSDGTSEDIEYGWSIVLAKPSLSKSVQYNSITLKWNTVKDANYTIYNCDSKGKKCKSIGTTTNTSYVINKLSFNNSYYYKVKVDVKIGENSYTNISNLYGVKTALAAPVLEATTDYYQYTKLSWTKVSGATKYYIYRCNSSGSKCSNVASTSKTSYTYKGGSEGYAYKYKVRAYKSKTYGSYSNLAVGKKVNDAISFSVSNTGYREATIIINNTTPSAIAYKIYRSTSKNGKYSLVTTLKGEDAKLKYVNTKLSFNKTYYYKVVASSEFNSSAYSSYKYVTTKGLAKPTITTTLIDDNKAKFETNKVSGATGYEYYYSTDGKNYKLLKRTTSQSYTKTFSYKKYYLKVRSYFYYNKKYYYSSFTSIDPITFIETLKGISINIDSKVPLGEKIKLSVDYTPSHIIEDITYTVSDESIAEIINGEFIGKKEGNVKVSATSESGVTTSKEVYVYIGTTKFEINKKQTTVYLNDSETLVVNYAPSNATFKDIKWSSSDSSIVTVDSNGVVKGLKEGIAKITASNDEGKKYTSYVTVKEQPIIFSGNGFDEINNLNLTAGVYTAKILLEDDSKINYVYLYDNNGAFLERVFSNGNKNNDSAFIKWKASSTLNNAKLEVNITGKWTIIIEKQIVGKTDFEIEGDYSYISETLVGTGSYVKIDYELLSYGSNVILYYTNSYKGDIEGQITTIEYLQSISITGSSSSISGSRVVFLEKNKKYFLSVESTDHWKVKMSPFKPSTSTWNSISGTGNSVSNIFTGTGYPIVFDLNVNKIDGSYDFSVLVCEYKQNYCFDLKNIYSNNGDYSGKVSFVSEKGKQYFLSVATRANWTIKVGKVSGTIGNTISGTGDYVSGFYEGKGKNYTFNINLDSVSSDYSRIYIYKYDKYYDYNYTSLVSTQELSYSGESVAYLEKGKKYYFVITTKGDWNINIKSAPSNKIGSVIEGSGDDAVGYIIGTGKYYILEGEFLENKNNRYYYTSVNFSPYNYSYPTTAFSLDLFGQYFKGKTVVFLEKGVRYYVSVKSNTKWKVKFSTSFSTLKNKSISGNGYSVSGLFTATSSTMSFNVKTDKPLTYDSNVVEIYEYSDTSGCVWEQLVWSSDAVNKKVKVRSLTKGKKYFFVIRTGGDWSISW